MQPRSNPLLPVLALVALALQSAFAIEFEKDILPILEENCLDCHGPDSQKSEFRVDQRAVMLIGGDSGLASVIPHDPAKSFLLEVIDGSNPDMQMPPKGDPLSETEVGLIREWITQGAVWPGQMDAVVAEKSTDHWSFQPVDRPKAPLKMENPIDAFLNAKLEEADLPINGPANARAMVRRASIVLTGLPPTPERVSEFEAAWVEDPNAAYESLVDELLASEHFGERWAQHWLDVIRWAETNGSEANLYRKGAWLYRDYVIRAFNDDVPYDQFIREQLAGDQMGVGEATGFLVAGPHVPAATVGREPSAIRQARADRLDEVMQTIGASMMGVTVSCARCHNHKFDPVSIQDYYSMAAVFQGVEFGGRYVEFAEDHPKRDRVREIRSTIGRERAKLRNAVGQWEENWGGYEEFHFPATETTALRIQFDRLAVFFDELQMFGPEEINRNYALAREGTELKEDPRFLNERARVENTNDGQFGTMSWRAKAPQGSKEKPWVEMHFDEAQSLNRFRFSSNREYFFETDYLDRNYNPSYPGFTISALQPDGSWKQIASTHAAEAAIKKDADLKAASERLHEQIAIVSEEGPQHSFVGRFTKHPTVTHVLHRGSPESPRDEVVPAGFEILNGELGLDSSTPDPMRRKEFANWLTREDHPLTSRVMVNRIWHHLFGSGIVPTGSDFGIAGAPPSHPELLDWLASEFVKPTQSESAPWSMKTMIRLMVMSDAFRRSSDPHPVSMKEDVSGIFLWRYPPQRVEAEVIRDGILQASGKLTTSLGGRGFRIHNVKKTYAQWEVVDNHGPETWRRMIYQERMRRVDDRMFTAFDFPDCGQVRAKRPVSTTPLQALNLMNSPFAVQQSGFIAERARNEAGADKTAQVHRVFELLLNRPATEGELKVCLHVVEASGLNVVARSVINSNEFAFLP